MALFFVVALQGAEASVDEAISAKILATDLYKIESGKFVVDAPTISTSKELSEFLGLLSAYSHFIVPVRGYYGRSKPDLWEWLSAKTSKANA